MEAVIVDLVGEGDVVREGDGGDVQQHCTVADPAMVADDQPPREVDVDAGRLQGPQVFRGHVLMVERQDVKAT